MKNILSLFLFALICSVGFAQQNNIFRIDSLPPQGILLDKGWRWQAGDNPDFAKADFNDSKWENIDPTKDIFALPQVPKKGEIFWLRLRFQIDSTLDRQLVMLLQQSGASEVYLQGKLLHRFGVVSQDRNNTKAYTPAEQPISFPIPKSIPQLLAVRYAFQPHIRYGTHFATTNKCFAVTLDTPEGWFEKHKFQENRLDLDVMAGSFYLLLSILFFALYLYYPKQKSNLYFAIYTGLVSVPYLYTGIVKYFNHVESIYWRNNLLLAAAIVAVLFLLKAIYHIFDKKTPFSFWFIALFGLVCIPLSLFVYDWGWVAFGIGYNITVYLEIIRIAIGGVVNKKKGAWIIAAGGFSVFVFWFLFLFSVNIFSNFSPYSPYFYAVAQICLPLSVALFLGYKFAQTNISLQQKLTEVEALSAEKQQILATQNETLERQVAERTAQLQASQAQLIQKEKLASLGELTAGIAHEIQNPLNFVNNFSELSIELIEELKVERSKGKDGTPMRERDEALENELLSDLAQNQEKINLHGKRASNIVKGMLEHSRTSSGERQLTDINQLADEYLRLAYHGLRAKDSSFNATLVTDFDSNLPKVEVIPQDIGRVLLNLYNNAFYAVVQKQKTAPADYKPTVSIQSQRSESGVEIRIRDNGVGIPDSVKAKIFQPFFTTKPTGEGTGLGLSLAYDIVTKGHGGTLECESVEGEGTTFTVKLPIQNQ